MMKIPTRRNEPPWKGTTSGVVSDMIASSVGWSQAWNAQQVDAFGPSLAFGAFAACGVASRQLCRVIGDVEAPSAPEEQPQAETQFEPIEGGQAVIAHRGGQGFPLVRRHEGCECVHGSALSSEDARMAQNDRAAGSLGVKRGRAGGAEAARTDGAGCG